jgi:CBS domain-containing protein/anti-sigma regulatory factor (Ser/Thr protein kinase)
MAFTKTQEMIYEMKVDEVMTRRVVAVHPDHRMSELRRLLRENRISGIPVVDKGQLVGLISVEDFIKWLADRQDDCPIQERMTTKLETLHHDDPLVLAVSKFDKLGLGRFPVIDRTQGKLLGIVTKGDVIEGLLKKLEIYYEEEEVQRHVATHIIFVDIDSDDTSLYCRYDVKGQDFALAGSSSSRLKKTLKSLGLRPDVIRRIAIASYEAEMNLVVFTQGGHINATVQPNQVFLEVSDSGPGIPDIQKALEPGYSTAPDWVRELGFGAGMGLVNIQRSSDRFEIRSEPDEGTLLAMTFFIE